MLAGKTIDNYEMLKILGRGGMGIVYKAMDKTLEKYVAVKMIDPNLAEDESFMRRFRTEAKALARLNDPNIVNVYAMRETEQGLLMVMEFVEGNTLSDWLSARVKVSFTEAIPLFKQLLKAISHAHKIGVVHRDIKPRNILVTDEGVVKVTDFGLARLEHGPDSTVTRAGGGTLRYMSPEQIKSVGSVGHQTDIYSIGMTFYEVLAGRTPFEESDTEFFILKTIVEDKFPPPNKFNPLVPKPLVKIVMKAIQKEPSKRYQNAEEMLAALDDFEATLKPDFTGYVSKPLSHKLPFIALSILFIAILLFAVAFVFLPQFPLRWKNSDLKTATDSASQAEESGLFVENNTRDEIDSVFSSTSLLAESDQQQSKDKLPALPVFGRFQVSSRPQNASVFLNGRYVGTTPYEDSEIKPGQYVVSVQLTGYEDFSKSVKVKEGRVSSLNVDLIGVGNLKITSTPSDADVLLNGKRIGKTPLDVNDVAEGKHKLVVRKKSWKEYFSQIDIEPSKTVSLHADLVALAGTLKILVIPWGSVFINNELRAKDSAAQYTAHLPAKEHFIRVEHPVLGKWHKTVAVTGGMSRDIIVDFNKKVKVTVTSEPVFCEIYLDGKPTGKFTPKELSVNVGLHTIGVRREGLVLSGGDRTINFDESLTAPIHFTMQSAIK